MFSVLQGYKGYVRNPDGTDGWIQKDASDYVFAKVFADNIHAGKPVDMPAKFDLVSEHEPTNLAEMLELVKYLTTTPNVVAIRGRRRDLGNAFRRNGANFDTTVPSNIIVMDIDDMPMPEGIDALDIRAQATYVVGLLHKISAEMFPLNMGFIAHASSSAGIKKGNIRLHMVLEANTKVTQGQIKYFMSEINRTSVVNNKFEIADLALYSATQLHYFADPIFYNPDSDPFKKENKSRLAYRKGSQVVLPNDLPDFTLNKGKFEPEFFTLLDSIKGKNETTERIEDVIKELEEAQDGAYLRIIPKLYHRALEEGINLDYLEREIRPALEEYILTKDSERKIEDYFLNGRRECLKGFVNTSKRDVQTNIKGINVRSMPTASGQDDQYLAFSDLPPANHISFVKASLGTGKTTAVVKWLDAGMVEGGFLAITNTRALVSSNAKKFGAGQYDKSIDMMSFKQDKINRMSTTIHSLHKFKALVEKIDFVFIDECDAVMNDLLFAPVVKQRSECIQVLYEIMRHAKYIVLSDGDISSETVEAYGSLIEFEKPVAVYKHHRRMLHGANAYEFPDESSIWVALQTALDLGEKCILVSDCGPPELGEKGIALRASTGCIVKEIHSASTGDVDIRRILDYTTDELRAQKIDALLCSPSVTSGVDFNYFDNIFVITRSANQSPNMRFQAIRRDRGAKNIYYFTDKATGGFQAGSDQFMVQQGWMERSQQIFAKRREIESRNYCSTLRYYLVDQGASIDIFSESWGKIDSAAAEYTEERINAILCATSEYSPLRHNDAYEAKLMCIQYYHLDSIAEVTREVVESFVKDKPQKRAEFFHKIQGRFWNSISKCNSKTVIPFIEELKKHKKDFFILTGQSANPRFAKMYLGMAGLKDLDDKSIPIDWYRTYCKMEGIQLPEAFMTIEEYKAYKESCSELGSRNEQMDNSEESTD